MCMKLHTIINFMPSTIDCDEPLFLTNGECQGSCGLGEVANLDSGVCEQRKLILCALRVIVFANLWCEVHYL